MKPKICIVTRSKPVHFEAVSILLESNAVKGVLMLTDDYSYNSGLWYDFFKAENEKSMFKLFGDRYCNIYGVEVLTLSKGEINSNRTYDFLNKFEPDITIFFDTEYLNNDTISKIKGEKWKIHEGYVEDYKGVYGNIFACIDQKPHFTCMSLIVCNDTSDKGDIIHQAVPVIRSRDTITDITYKAIRKMLHDLLKIIEKYSTDKLEYKKQEEKGNFYTSSDLKEKYIEKLSKDYNFLVKEIQESNLKPCFYKQI